MKSLLDFDDPALASVHASKSAEIVIGDPFALSDCQISKCAIEKLKIIYEMKFDGEAIEGFSFCEAMRCSFDTMSHTISTTNTPKIFQKLNSIRIFSPLTSAYLYGFIASGEKNGDGHKITFN